VPKPKKQQLAKQVAQREAVLKQVSSELGPLAQRVQALQETVARLARRPRGGGPSLNGNGRH